MYIAKLKKHISDQGCQILLDTIYQNGENICTYVTNEQKYVYQISIK
jgi:hypothetical protein